MTHADGEHGSVLRELMAQAAGSPYRSFASLVEAQADPNGCVVLEGDDGGQLYVVFPASDVRCSEAELEQLLRDLDAVSWPENDPSMARVVFERRDVGSPVAGGMGGGTVTPGGWVHPAFRELGIEVDVRSVLGGEAQRLTPEARSLRRP